MIFKIETRTEGREVYMVEAPNDWTAKDLFLAGEITNPVVSEVISCDVVKVEAER